MPWYCALIETFGNAFRKIHAFESKALIVSFMHWRFLTSAYFSEIDMNWSYINFTHTYMYMSLYISWLCSQRHHSKEWVHCSIQIDVLSKTWQLQQRKLYHVVDMYFHYKQILIQAPFTVAGIYWSWIQLMKILNFIFFSDYFPITKFRINKLATCIITLSNKLSS